METLFDVIGVALIIWGAVHVLVGVLQMLLVFFGGREAGLGKGLSFGAGFVFLVINAGWGGFLIWGGLQIVGIQKV